VHYWLCLSFVEFIGIRECIREYCPRLKKAVHQDTGSMPILTHLAGKKSKQCFFYLLPQEESQERMPSSITESKNPKGFCAPKVPWHPLKK